VCALCCTLHRWPGGSEQPDSWSYRFSFERDSGVIASYTGATFSYETLLRFFRHSSVRALCSCCSCLLQGHQMYRKEAESNSIQVNETAFQKVSLRWTDSPRPQETFLRRLTYIVILTLGLEGPGIGRKSHKKNGHDGACQKTLGAVGTPPHSTRPCSTSFVSVSVTSGPPGISAQHISDRTAALTGACSSRSTCLLTAPPLTS